MKETTGKEIAQFVINYITELDETENRVLTRGQKMANWEKPLGPIIKVNFDGVFDERSFRFASGVVARDQMEDVLRSESSIHRRTTSRFAAKALAC